MYENTKAAFLRRSNNRLFTNVFKGDGLHISPGNDPLKQQHYPLCKSVTLINTADSKIETDTLKQQLGNREFDFVYATNLAFYEDPIKRHLVSLSRNLGQVSIITSSILFKSSTMLLAEKLN